MAQTALMIGMSSTILQGRSYALPAKKVSVNSSAAVEVGMDEVAWNSLPNANTTGADTGMRFIRCPGGSATVICHDAYKNTGGSSGGSSLPTAPLGQVLISQGDGIPSVYSPNPSVNYLGASSHMETNISVVNTLRLQESPLGGKVGIAPGELANFSDSTVNTKGSVVVGGGTNHILARWNGTNWLVV